MRYALGKGTPSHGVSFKFADFFDASKLPPPPPVFGHWREVPNYHMLGNDVHSNCIYAGAAHEHMLWTVMGGRPRSRFTTKDVLSDYAAVTGFNPADPNTDQGGDMGEAARYRRKTGIIDASGKRHLIDAYVELEVGNYQQLLLAAYLTGAVGIGIQICDGLDAQFDKRTPWTVPAHPRIQGGHYVPMVGREPSGNGVVITWGRAQEMTPAYYERFNDETVAYLSFEILNNKNLSPDGFDAAGLRAKLTQAAGGKQLASIPPTSEET